MTAETADLGVSGLMLFEDLADEADPYAVTALIVEAARVKDRLDKLDQLLCGEIETWVALVHDLRTEDYELKINSAASESRQQATLLRQLIVEIKRLKGDGGGKPSSDDDLAGL